MTDRADRRGLATSCDHKEHTVIRIDSPRDCQLQLQLQLQALSLLVALSVSVSAGSTTGLNAYSDSPSLSVSLLCMQMRTNVSQLFAPCDRSYVAYLSSSLQLRRN